MPRRTRTVADGIRILLECDQQVLGPRPSHFGLCARAVYSLAIRAIGRGLFDTDLLGDIGELNLDQVDRQAPRHLDQPLLDAIELEADRAALVAAGKRLLEAIAEPSEIVREMVMDNVVQAMADAIENAERSVP